MVRVQAEASVELNKKLPRKIVFKNNLLDSRPELFQSGSL
jgi:hypothetical protein